MRIKKLFQCNKCTFNANLRPEFKDKIEASHQRAYNKDLTHFLEEVQLE